MIVVSCFRDQRVAIVGLGRSGLAAARALRAGGADVLAWDDNPAQRAAALAAGVTVGDLSAIDWSGFAALVLSPGVPLTHPAPHPFVCRAAAAGCEIMGDIELFARTIQGDPRGEMPKIIGVTGTNGKSTTTALIGHLLAAAGRRVEVGGNIGRPALDLPMIEGAGAYVLELSSYQIDLTRSLKPDVAVLLNISPDHLDRHGTFGGYVAVKKRLFHRQTTADVAIVGTDDPESSKICEELRRAARQVVPISVTQRLASGMFVADGTLFDAMAGAPVRIVDLSALERLPGAHNWQNAAAAFAAGRTLGLDSQDLVAGLATFPGLPHRIEPVGVIRGVRFVNDSKATNAEAAARAVACFDDIFLILGGRPKTDGLAALRPLLSHVRKAYLIGEATETFAAELSGIVPFECTGDLPAAVTVAARDAWRTAAANPVVLLSPACASFDQFRDFEARGDAFRELVGAMVAHSEPESAA